MDKLSDKFHFGWCNACERYAAGHTPKDIIASPTSEATITTQREAFAVTAGVHAALACIEDPHSLAAWLSAKNYGLTQGQVRQLIRLTLDV